jgi:hypothetical protein
MDAPLQPMSYVGRFPFRWSFFLLGRWNIDVRVLRKPGILIARLLPWHKPLSYSAQFAWSWITQKKLANRFGIDHLTLDYGYQLHHHSFERGIFSIFATIFFKICFYFDSLTWYASIEYSIGLTSYGTFITWAIASDITMTSFNSHWNKDSLRIRI